MGGKKGGQRCTLCVQGELQLTLITCLCRIELLQDILRGTPEAKGRLLVDLINEPDGYDLTWDVSQQNPSFERLHDLAQMSWS